MRLLNDKKNIFDNIKIVKNVTLTDKSDIRIFNTLLNNNDKLSKTNKTGNEVYPIFNELHQDLFNIFYKYKPILNDSENIERDYILNEEIIKSIMSLDKYKEIRNITKFDDMATSIGMEYVGEEVFNLIEKLNKEHEELLTEIKSNNEALLDLESKDTSNLSQEEIDTLHIKYNDAVKLFNEQKEKLSEVISKENKFTINQILDKTIKHLKDVDNIITNWGLGNSTEFQNMGYQEKIKLLDKLRSPRITAITNLLGRFKQLAIQSQKQKIKKGFNEVDDVVLGSDITKVLMIDLSKIMHPILKKLFFKSYLENGLLIYKYSTKEKKQRGPIIICIDNSGSMSGQPEIWSKTVGLAILEIARIQKRSCFIIHFDSQDKSYLPVYEFKKNTSFNLPLALEMCSYFSCGGTDFQEPLELSQDKITQDGDFEKADIVFITDGEAPVSDSWLKNFLLWKKEKKVNIYSVLIDLSYNTTSSLKLFSDTIYKLEDLTTDTLNSTAINIFDSL